MEKEFVPYPLALRLKELGFNEPCVGYYDGNHNFNYMFQGKPQNFSYKKFPLGHSVGWTSAPTFSQAFRWLTEKHDLYYSILPRTTSGHRLSTTFNIVIYAHSYNINVQAEIFRVNGEIAEYADKEEAELDCLSKLIEIVEGIES